MIVNITIDGRLPGINDLISAERTNKYKGAAIKKKAQKHCEEYIKRYARNTRFTKPVHINYRFYELNRRRDRDNVSGFAHKVIQDALVECGVLKDDGWNEITSYSDGFYVDKHHPRIEVTICD